MSKKDVWHMLLADFKRVKNGTREERLALADAWAAYIEQREAELERLRKENAASNARWAERMNDLHRLHRIEEAMKRIADPDQTYEGGNPDKELPSDIARTALEDFIQGDFPAPAEGRTVDLGEEA